MVLSVFEFLLKPVSLQWKRSKIITEFMAATQLDPLIYLPRMTSITSQDGITRGG